MVLLHGRGASAEDILALGRELWVPGLTLLAPQAAGGTWYPERFTAPLERNEPWLSSALSAVGRVVEEAGRWLPAERTLLLGFSQGGCLALEYTARRPRRYGGVAGLSAALIGPPGTPRHEAGSLDGTPVFLGCSDVDPHIPVEMVVESAEVLRRMGAEVTVRLYPGMGHLVSEDEVTAVREMASSVTGRGAGRPR